MRVEPAPDRPWDIQGEQLTILKNAVCKGASNTELEFCLTVAKRYKLDPFKRQIWFVSRWDKNADNGKGGTGANVWTPQVGIDGLLFMSARDHKVDFGSVSLPEYGPMHKPDGTSIQAPEWAKVKVFKKGVEAPTEAIAYWEEYAPSDMTKAPFWRKMPRRMIGKCATALALRQAYPDLGGIYIPEECDRMGEEHTESGRQIVSGVPTGGSREAAQAVAQRKIAEASTKPIEAEIVHDAPKEREWQGDVELDWSENEASPILRGDIGNLLEALKPHCTLTWQGDWWHCAPRDAEVIRRACEELAYRLEEIMPKKVSRTSSEDKGGKGAAQTKAQAQGKAAPPSSGKEAQVKPAAAGAFQTRTETSDAPLLVQGTIERVFVTLKGDKSMALVTIKGPDGRKHEAGCWNKSIYEALDKGKGKEAVVYFQKKGQYTNLVDLKRIGATEYEEGKPVIQQSAREAGGRTLFP